MRILLAVLILVGLAGEAHACNVPNPNLLAPPFVDGCDLPAVALNKVFSHFNNPSLYVTSPLAGTPNGSASLSSCTGSWVGVFGLGCVYSQNGINVPTDTGQQAPGCSSAADGGAPCTSVDWFINHTMGSTTSTGFRIPLWVNLSMTAAQNNPNNSYTALYGIYSTTDASQPMTGIGGPPYGAIGNYSGVTQLKAGSVNWLAVNNMEMDTAIYTGASAYIRQAYSAISQGNINGGAYDAAYHVGAAAAGGHAGWMAGISVDASHSTWGIDACGTIITTAQVGAALTPCGITNLHAMRGIDMSNVVFGQYSVALPGFLIGPNGNTLVGGAASGDQYLAVNSGTGGGHNASSLSLDDNVTEIWRLTKLASPLNAFTLLDVPNNGTIIYAQNFTDGSHNKDDLVVPVPIQNSGMPTTCTSHPAGTLWNSSGTVHVC